MRHLPTLLRREVGTLFLTPALYIVMALFTLLSSYVFLRTLEAEEAAVFEPMAMFIGVLSVFSVPLITMRSFAGETGSGTIELLLTSPVTSLEIVLSKFFAAMVFFLVTLLPCAAYVAILAWFGDIDDGLVLTNIVGLLFLGALYVSIGLFASCLTDSVIVAATGGCVGIGLLLFLNFAVEEGAGLYTFPAYLSFWSHFKLVFLRGLIDTRSLLFFLTLPLAMLFLTWLRVESRGILGRPPGRIRRRWRFVAAVLALAAGHTLLYGYVKFDIQGRNPARLWPIGEEGVAPFLSTLAPWILAALLFVAAILALRLSRDRVSHPSSLLRREIRSRSAAWPTFLGAFSVLLLLVDLNLLGTLVYRRWDLTERQINTLAPITRQTLDELTDPLVITVFLSNRVDYGRPGFFQEIRDLLTEFTSYSPKIRIQYLDAIDQATEADRVAKRMGLGAIQLETLITLEYQGRRLVLPAGIFLKAPDWRQEMAGIKTPSFNGEQPFTIAIKRLLDPRRTRIYFATGHDEMSIASQEMKPRMVGRFAAALRQENFEVKTWLFAPERPIPYDCDVLVLADPRIPYEEVIIEQIQAYLDAGNGVLVLLPSPFESEKTSQPGLWRLMESWGCRPRADLVFDPENCHRKVMTTVYAVVNEMHAIARGMRRMVCALPKARSLHLLGKKPGETSEWQTDRLLVTLSTARRQEKKRGQEAESVKGQTAVAIAATRIGEKGRPEARVVVVGNAEFASNLFFGEANNHDFLLSCAHWLAGRHYDIQIEERDYTKRFFTLSVRESKLLWWGVIVLLPEIWALLGAWVWWMRKE